MGRVRGDIKINNRIYWTLFDSGSRNTYVIEDIANSLPQYKLPQVRTAALGGKVYNIAKGCILLAEIEGLPIEVDAYVIDEIGTDEDDKRIEVLFGALAMQKWGIRLIPDKEKLDITHYPKEFLEF